MTNKPLIPRPSPFAPRPSQVIAWAMYDWANSAYSTLLITVVFHYFPTLVFPRADSSDKLGEAVYAFGIGGAMFLAAVLSPIVGAVADANRSKHRWLAGTALCGAAATVAMALMPLDHAWLIVTMFVLMGVCFELSLVPYNGLLLEITDERSINLVSALGYALGYAGGSVPLVAAWLIFKYGRQIGLANQTDQYTVCIVMLGLWWGIFSLPSILILRDRGRRPEKCAPLPRAARNAVGEVRNTIINIRRFPILALFLLAFLFYNDGMQTVLTQANALAVDEFHFSIYDLFLLVLMIQLIALPGALLVGKLSDLMGQKPVLLACLAVWSALLVAAAVVNDKTSFWIMGVVLALVMGGTQSVSRAMMGMMTPERHAAEFFGFFNLSGKAASVLGPVQFGLIIYLSDNARWAAVSLLIFFIVGIVLMARIDVVEGRRQAAKRGEGREERGEG
ncbi:MAG: MFS transporter [Pirellulales bacterium]|nr:MFS transporter [Pirellulales bacterium]